jgi:hypothetical protein
MGQFQWNSEPQLFNDGSAFHAGRESFQFAHNHAVRLTMQHPDNGKAARPLWWKTAKGFNTAADFASIRKQVMATPVTTKEEKGIIYIAVQEAQGKLEIKANPVRKKVLKYYYPLPLPKDFLFTVDGKEIGKPILIKYPMH